VLPSPKTNVRVSSNETLIASSSGKAYLTDQRIIYQVDKRTSFSSIAMPLYFLKRAKLEQPIFGANYIEAELLPVRRDPGTREVHVLPMFIGLGRRLPNGWLS